MEKLDIMLAIICIFTSGYVGFSIGFVAGYEKCSNWWRAEIAKMLPKPIKSKSKSIDMEI